MILEAIWFKNGIEIRKVSPVMNLLCDDNMVSIKDIEVKDDLAWWFEEDADDFVIRIKE